MPKPFRVIQIGIGSLGHHITSSIQKRTNIELLALVDLNPELVGERTRMGVEYDA